MRGAVLSAMGLKIQSRVARCHYGFTGADKAQWDDPAEMKFWDEVLQYEKSRRVVWFAKMVPSHPHH
jgi:hypothetical protein